MGVMLGIFKAQIPLGSSRHDTSDVSSESSSSCRTCRAVLLDKLDTAKMHGLSCRDVTSQVEFGLNYDPPDPVKVISVSTVSKYEDLQSTVKGGFTLHR